MSGGGRSCVVLFRTRGGYSVQGMTIVLPRLGRYLVQTGGSDAAAAVAGPGVASGGAEAARALGVEVGSGVADCF